MGRSGYTSLSLEQGRYKRLRDEWDRKIGTKDTFTTWAADVLESAIKREDKLKKLFPKMIYAGKTSRGILIEEKEKIIQIFIDKNTITCSVDKGICNHILFACIHPKFSE